MIYLATASGPAVVDAIRSGLLGQMVTPESRNTLVGATWAIDNGCFSAAWNPDRWRACLARYADQEPRPLFVVVPDVVGDAKATNTRWAHWHGTVRNLGYRGAYVLQDGCESIPASAAAVFIGGTTEWKLGPDAQRLAADAKRTGLWLHMGRVNSLRRLRLAAEMGCDSVDGTLLAFGPDKHLPKLLRWLEPAAPGLFGGVA